MRIRMVVRSVALLGSLLVSLLAGGCVRNLQPVLKDEQVISNDALLGNWISKDGKVSAHLSTGDAKHYKLSYTNDTGKTGNFLVRFGKIGDVSVAELSADAFNAQTSDEYKSLLVPMYLLMVIDKTQPQLSLTGLNIDWLKKYTHDHPDELNMDKNNPEDLVVLASTEEFQAFCTKHFKDTGMLNEPVDFVRPGDATTQPAAK